jgi:hypothetical protein
MDPGTILSIVSLIIQTLERIGALVTEARQFKQECQELGAISAALKFAIEKNQSALSSHKSCADLRACLADVEMFIMQCNQRWNVLKHAREVFFDHRVQQLRQRLLGWMSVFTLEGSVSTLYLSQDTTRG